MSNAFDMVRKIRHLPGINLKATIEPQHISKRVKNAAQKMIRSGVLVGGYTSKARILAEQMFDTHHQQAVGSATTWSAVAYDMALLTKAGREHLVELTEAARLIAHTQSRDAMSVNARFDELIARLGFAKRGRFVFYAGNDKNFHAQMLEVIAACRTPEHVKAHAALADRLDNPEPITINIYE
jgi:cobalamin biosynthesis protein CbiD